MPDYDKIRYTGKRKEYMTKRNRNRTKNQIKNDFIKSVYGITLKDFDKMVKNQKGVCAICGKSETRKSRYGGICRLTIDHDHKTKEVRGLLCNACNRGLGGFKDNISIMENAIKYLKKFGGD